MSTLAAARAVRGGAFTIWLAGLLGAGGYAVLYYLDRGIPPSVYGFPGGATIAGLAMLTVGALIVSRLPRHPVGWLFCAAGLLFEATALATVYALYSFKVVHQAGALGSVAAWFGSWGWAPGLAVCASLILSLFPTGRLPSARWRPAFGYVIIAFVVFVVGLALQELPQHGVIDLGNDGQIRVSGHDVSTVQGSGVLSLVFPVEAVAALIGIAALATRYRRAGAAERMQLKWFYFACALFILTVIGETVSGLVSDGAYRVASIVLVAAIPVIPIGAGMGILRHRLLDIDVIISRALVYGALAAFITAVYVAIAVGVGALAGSGGRPNLGLSILATAIVAVGFQPVRLRMQRVANRVVYGNRATPYEVLSQFSQRVAETYEAADVLPRMARVLQEGTGAESATVWLRSGAELRLASTHPPGANGAAPVPLSDGSVTIPGTDYAVAVHSQGQLLGALAIVKQRGEPLTPIEQKLVDDLAHQAGLVLKNVGLTADLQARIAELRRSRQRLVTAQDEERRRLERNLHDGAQQHLVALKVKLGLTEVLAERDPSRARATLQELKADADEALETLRDLARGIYPPLLAEKGLAVAVESQARKAAMPVSVSADGTGRYAQEVEATVYFCVLEAVQNATKYAQATQVTVRLRDTDGTLAFEVQDDGRGFDAARVQRGAGLTNITDRLDAIGGTLEITSAPGRGTLLRGSVVTPTAA